MMSLPHLDQYPRCGSNNTAWAPESWRGVCILLFEKLKALPSGNILCFVKTGVSQKGPPSLCDQFGGEAIVELSRFHAAFVLDRVDFWGCHTLETRFK